MTFNIGRRQFLMGSSALLAAGALARPAFAQSDALRLYWWGGQTRADSLSSFYFHNSKS